MKLSNNEIRILENYQFAGDEFSKKRENRFKNEHLLCLKKVNGAEEIQTVNRTDVTAWEIFKSYLGFGKLSGCTLRLKAISAYLEKRESPQGEAARTIHGIASRMLIYKKSIQLYEKIATEAKKFTLETFGRFHGNFPDFQISDKTLSSKELFLFLTPYTKVGHLVAQVDLLEGRSFKETEASKKDEFKYRQYYLPRYFGPIALSSPADEKTLENVRFTKCVQDTYGWNPFSQEEWNYKIGVFH